MTVRTGVTRGRSDPYHRNRPVSTSVDCGAAYGRCPHAGIMSLLPIGPKGGRADWS